MNRYKLSIECRYDIQVKKQFIEVVPKPNLSRRAHLSQTQVYVIHKGKMWKRNVERVVSIHT